MKQLTIHARRFCSAFLGLCMVLLLFGCSRPATQEPFESDVIAVPTEAETEQEDGAVEETNAADETDAAKEPEQPEPVEAVLILSGSVDPKRVGVGDCMATFTLYANGAYEGYFDTKFGGLVISSGTWTAQDNAYTLTEKSGKDIPVYRNADGELELTGVWDAGSLKNLDVTVTEGGITKDAEETVEEQTEAIPLVYTDPVTVTGGEIVGTLSADGQVASYKGIPYAAAPIGELRWKAAAPVNPWEGVRRCDSFTANPINFVTVARTGFDKEFGIDAFLPMTEDSLFVNVWTQTENEGNSPVLFFIPGGGFTTGGTSCPLYDGETLAKKGVVFVTVNYRLGALGFMAHPELSADGNGSGFYAMSDLIAALTWVQENIAAFGGDPKNVTVMGQSAGSRITHALVASPKASGLFQKAFTASADIMDEKIYQQATSEAATAAVFGDQTLAQLREADGTEIVKTYGSDVRLVIDGVYLPEKMRDAYVDGTANRLTMVMGLVNGDVVTPTVGTVAEYEAAVRSTYGDGADLLLDFYKVDADNTQETMQRLSEDAALMRLQYQTYAYSLGAKTPSYVYYMTHPYPQKNTPAVCEHTQDLPYWFDHIAAVRKPYLTDTDTALAEQMSDLLTSFAKTGVPSEAWTSSSGNGAYLRIGDTITMETVPEEVQTVWNAYYRTVFGF